MAPHPVQNVFPDRRLRLDCSPGQTNPFSGWQTAVSPEVPDVTDNAAAAYAVRLEEEQSRAIRAAFFRTYTRLRQWHGESHNRAKRGVTEVRTRMGRRRLIPESASSWERFTALVNTPVQGGTADGMKRAIILVSRRLPQTARIISTVHDELIVECPDDLAEECRTIVSELMVEAMAKLYPEVPIEVETNICENWGEK